MIVEIGFGILAFIIAEYYYLFVVDKETLEKEGYFAEKVFALMMGGMSSLILYIIYYNIMNFEALVTHILGTINYLVTSQEIMILGIVILMIVIILGYFKGNELLRKYIDKKRDVK